MLETTLSFDHPLFFFIPSNSRNNSHSHYFRSNLGNYLIRRKASILPISLQSFPCLFLNFTDLCNLSFFHNIISLLKSYLSKIYVLCQEEQYHNKSIIILDVGIEKTSVLLINLKQMMKQKDPKKLEEEEGSSLHIQLNLISFVKILNRTEMTSSYSSSSSVTAAVILLVLLYFTCSFHKLLAESKHSNSTTLHSHHQHTSPNPRLQQAYVALKAWKLVIYSDPTNFTSNWVGPSVCSYNGVYCAPSLEEPDLLGVAGIDLNHKDIAGFLPDELGLLSDLALLHLNSNRFCGILPQTLANLSLLFELDLSNNRFVGPFPTVVLSLDSLKFLDLRYNEFEGPLPSEIFARSFDAIFVNNNRLTSVIPSNINESSASVIVFANNNLGGCLPPSIAKLANNLEELVLINTNLTGCLTPEVGFLYKLKVLDVSSNKLMGPLPYTIAGLRNLEQLNVAHNMFDGDIPEAICALPNLQNFTYSYNFFCEEEGLCRNLTSKGIVFDDRWNCLPEKPLQRSKKVCEAVHPVDCIDYECGSGGGGGGGVAAPPSLPPSHS